MPRAMQTIVEYRSTPLAGVYLAITRRCPFACAHCSTRSSPVATEGVSYESLQRFLLSFAIATKRPRIVYFTGGEALLYPREMAGLARIAREFGALTVAISGGFFGRGAALSDPLKEALSQLDALHLSRDRFHEPFLADEDFFRAIGHAESLGLEVSVQYTLCPDESRESVLFRLRQQFTGSVLFSTLMPVGRARDTSLLPQGWKSRGADMPCNAAAWPVVSYTGNIVFCCNQELVDEPDGRKIPDHLFGGRVCESTWTDVIDRRERASAILHPVSILGPASVFPGSKGTQCGTCRNSEGHKPVFVPLSKSFGDAVRALQASALATVIVGSDSE